MVDFTLNLDIDENIVFVGTSVSDEDSHNMYHFMVTVFPRIQPRSRWTTTNKSAIPSALLSWPSGFDLWNFKFPLKIPDFFKILLLTRETRHIVPSCNKAKIRVVYLKNNYNWMYCQILQRSAFWPTGQHHAKTQNVATSCNTKQWSGMTLPFPIFLQKHTRTLL